MSVEIEAKLKVDSLQQIKNRLTEPGAKFLEEQLQTDSYFDDASDTLKNSDRALRLRRLSVEGVEKVFLTYKGAKEKDNLKKRQELEIEINDAESAEKLLAALGFDKALVLQKKRQLWLLGKCRVALDHLPLLGDFVEIEGPDNEKIADVQRSLQLENVPHIPQSYASLIEEKLCQLGQNKKEVLL
ncbi:MAG: class IV adenylate cyclase [Planctomycetota bacterium]|nr:MAG: class IV adenylate cyclase [Planctomycetota bacterium]